MSDIPGEERNARGRTPLSGLLARATRSAVDIVKAEIDDYKAGVLRKLKESAVAIALFAVAGFVAIFAVSYLIFAIYQAFLVITPGWLAALITAAILLVVTGALAGAGAAVSKRHGMPDAGAAVDRMRTNITGAVADARKEHAEEKSADRSEEH